MAESPINCLHALTDILNVSKSSNEKQHQLMQAFNQFSENAKHLENSYAKLERRFKALTTQMEKDYSVLESEIEDLERVNHYLNNIVRHMNQGILFIGISGIITTCNKAAEKLLKISHETLIFHDYFTLFSDTFFGFSMKEALTTTHPENISLITQIDSGEYLEIGVNYISQGPLSNQGIMLLFRDMTTFKKLEKSAQRNDRMQELGEMAARVAHEIRNPLGGIQGFASLLHNDIKDYVHLKYMTEKILEGTRTLNRVVEDILEYARPCPTNMKETSLATLVKEITSFSKATFPENVVLEVSIDDTLPPLFLDEEQIKSALLNLFRNAVDAMPEGGTLSVTLSKWEDKVRLVVKDTGIGIEAEHLDEVFSPFFTTKAKGNGFGLSETYKIVQAHLGTIEVSSQKNQGTSFIICL